MPYMAGQSCATQPRFLPSVRIFRENRSKTTLPRMTRYCKVIEDNIKTHGSPLCFQMTEPKTSLLKNVCHLQRNSQMPCSRSILCVRLDHSTSPIILKARKSVCLAGMSSSGGQVQVVFLNSELLQGLPCADGSVNGKC